MEYLNKNDAVLRSLLVDMSINGQSMGEQDLFVEDINCECFWFYRVFVPFIIDNNKKVCTLTQEIKMPHRCTSSLF